MVDGLPAMAARARRKHAELIEAKVATGNPIADRKILVAIEDMPNHVKYQFLTEFSEENRMLLTDFLNDFLTRENIATNTKMVYIRNLLYLSRYLNHKAFKEIIRDDVMAYLPTLRRPLSADVSQKWIATHNNRLAIYQKFFKWLSYPDLAAKERPTPEVVRDLPQLHRKERTPVKAQDLWTEKEDALFLKYCDDPRLALFHIMALDTSARPHELLALRIGDVKIADIGGQVVWGNSSRPGREDQEQNSAPYSLAAVVQSMASSTS
jgi:integrase